MTTSLHAVDSAARNEYAALLRHFAAGVITNREFEMRMPHWREITRPEMDRAVWPLYDDFHEHKVVGDYRVTPQGREFIARMILFLRSDLPYRWPRVTGLAQLPATLFSILTLGTWVSGGFAIARRMAIRASGHSTHGQITKRRSEIRRTFVAHKSSNQAMQRTAGSLGSSLSMKFHPQPAATRHPASRR